MNLDGTEFLHNEYGITFSDRLTLQDSGLMSISDLTLQIPHETMAVVFADHVMPVESEIIGPAVIAEPVLIFTKSGSGY